MPFTPHLTLRLKEAAFAQYIEAKERNTIKEHYKPTLPEIKKVPNRAPQELDGTNSALIQFYDLVTSLTQIYHTIHAASKAGNSMEMIEATSLYVNGMTNVHLYLLYLKQDEELWNYLLTNKNGRLVFYFLIYLNLIHFNYLNSDYFNQELLKALNEHGAADHSEQLVLQFLGVQFNCIKNKLNPALISVDERVHNPFINAYWLFKSFEGLQSVDDKVEALLSLKDRPLSFSPATPAFIKQLIQLQYVKLFITGMGYSTAALMQIDTAHTLSKLGYFPEFKPRANEPSALIWVGQISDLLHYVYRVLHSFAFFNDSHLLLRLWHIDLLFFHAFSYYQIMHALPANEVKICKAKVSQEELLAQLTTMLNLLKIQNMVKNESVRLHQHSQLFWTAAKSIFCPVVAEESYVETLTVHIHTIYIVYARYGRFAELCDIVSSVLEFQELFHKLSSRDYTYYSNLLTALRSLRDLPKPLSDEQINRLLMQIEEKKQAFQLADVDWHVMKREKVTLLKGCDQQKQILALQSKVKLLDLRVAKSLEDLRQVAEPLRNEVMAMAYEKAIEDWSEEEKEGRQLEPVIKKKLAYKAASASASSTQNFFKPKSAIEVDAAYVPCDALPKALWDFASFIYMHTKKSLILGGSAATYLYLKKSNPRDYDFMLLDVQQEDLFKLLLEHGYKAQRVGRQVPIIKLQLEAEAGTLSIDLNTDTSRPGEPLNKIMEGILIKRDLKLSALYVVLTLGAKQLEVKGFDRAIRSLNNKVISIVNHKRHLFAQEPVCLFRLVKYCLLYCDFSLDGELQDIVQKTDMRLSFTSYINNPEFAAMHRGKLSTAMEDLFDRFEIAAVLHKMNELGIFSALWDLDYEDIKDSLHLLEPYNAQDAYAKKRAINVFFHMHYTTTHRDIKKLNNWPFYGVARCVKPMDQELFNWIEAAVLGKNNRLAPTVEAKNWLTLIQNHHLQPSALAGPK